MYCAVNGISKNEQDKITQYADNSLAQESSIELNSENSVIQKDATMFSRNYKKWVDEPYYDGALEGYQFLDCIMYYYS